MAGQFDQITDALVELRRCTELAFDQLNSNIDSKIEGLDSRIDSLCSRMDQRFNRLERKLDQFIDSHT